MVLDVARTDTFPLVNRLVPGGLAAFLNGAREAGQSHDTIAYRLRAEHGVVTSGETVRKWCARVNDPAEPEEAKAG